MRLLYVEDHPRFSAIVITEFLSAHEVTVAGTLAEARALLARAAFDVVLLDYDLPDGKGGELLTEIRRQQLAMRVIAPPACNALPARGTLTRRAKQDSGQPSASHQRPFFPAVHADC